MPELNSPRLSLEPVSSRKRTGGSALIVVLCSIVVVLQGVLLYLEWRGQRPASIAAAPESASEQWDLALALEQKSLPRQAALAFERFLEISPESKDRAQHLYHAGKLRMDAGDFEAAASHFVASELCAKKSDVKLPPELGQHLIECLRKLGRYGEVGRELARRVDSSQTDAKAKVLATYAGETITEADLDRWIEQRADQLVTMQGGDDALREKILQQISTPEARESVLRDVLNTDLLARRARELGLDQKPEHRESVGQAEQSLLANALLRQELGARRATRADLESYYELHRAEYRTPRSAEIVMIELGADENAEDLLAGIDAPDRFLAEAKARGEPLRAHLVEGVKSTEVGDYAVVLLGMQAGEWTRQPMQIGTQRRLALVESREDAREPKLEEIEAQVSRDYTTRKGQEIAEQVLADLMKRYDVKMAPAPSGKNQ